MVAQDKHLEEVFEQPPLTAYRRQNNLRDMLIKSKVPPPQSIHPKRVVKGMAKCGKTCTACAYVEVGKTIKIAENKIWKIEKQVNCTTYNCIYMIKCITDNCQQRYIGETGRYIKNTIADHRSYITNQVTSTATGAHFNLPGHSLADMKFIIIEQVKYNDESYRREREIYHISNFNTFHHGINREK